jgi:sensor histidine kinase YesM
LAVWLFYLFFFSYNAPNGSYVILFASLLMPITVLMNYVMNSILIPKYLNQGDYLWFGIYAFFSLLFTTFYLLLLLFLSLSIIKELSYEDLPPMTQNFIYLIILVYLVVLLLSFFEERQRKTALLLKNKALEQTLLQTQFKAKEQELAYLKSQIHPHFLFNTLNTIYGFALKKSDDTAAIILKLSNLLDYTLYQTNKPLVALKEEIAHLEAYIALESIRFKDYINIRFDKKLSSSNQQIPPLLLLPFVENAFKHGSIIDGFLSIDIQLVDQKDALFFQIKNSHKEEAVGKGLGLKNIQERLALLYPKNHDLQIVTKANSFEVKLVISKPK